MTKNKFFSAVVFGCAIAAMSLVSACNNAARTAPRSGAYYDSVVWHDWYHPAPIPPVVEPPIYWPEPPIHLPDIDFPEAVPY